MQATVTLPPSGKGQTMTSYRLFLAAFFILCLIPGAAQRTAFAADWRPADGSEFDASSISRISPSIIHVRQRVRFSAEVLAKLRRDRGHDYSDYSHTINLKRIDCSRRAIGAAGSTDYDVHGKVIQSFDETTRLRNVQMLPVAPDSPGDAFVRTVCGYVNKPFRK